jgi:hypothetical protein
VAILIHKTTVITNISGSPAAPLPGGDSAAKANKSLISASTTVSAAASSQTVLSQQVALAGRVIAQPSIRAEEVERAKALVASPNYPPRAIVEAVARLVAESNHALD